VSLDFLSEEDKEWILGKTLATVLKWPEAKELLHARKKRSSMESAGTAINHPILQQMKRAGRKIVGVVAWDYQIRADCGPRRS